MTPITKKNVPESIPPFFSCPFFLEESISFDYRFISGVLTEEKEVKEVDLGLKG